ncbi:hypothetical protein [Sphingomonas sp. M1-B02]|nr:hypothetical protein [Sphingomonas sp. S6-11]UZK67180.1 hypothetical protein OKW87_04940 [Sphingomonas sp. S6-11]
MASQPPTGPDSTDREEPGDTQTNPAGVSNDEPAEGNDDAAPKLPGSPEG